MTYECVIIGGGIAGLQAAIQLGRYGHDVLVIDSEEGRSNLCRSYHNLLGWPDGVGGSFLRKTGKAQAAKLGVSFEKQRVKAVKKNHDVFVVSTENDQHVEAKRLLLATGVVDRIPMLKDLRACLGINIYICPDCDGYEVKGKRVLVLGSGDTGANMALTLKYWTDEIVYINHDGAFVGEKLTKQLEQNRIRIHEGPITEIIRTGDKLKGVVLENEQRIPGRHAFVAFGGNEVKSDLAAQLGIELHHNRHILADARTKETSVKNVWAAGDVVAHSEQVAIAMGDGLQAAIWIHKSLISV
ncbi:NAD(P)/FAD-dependent oxidoreductase [Thalassobacillus hwangdonensis]|uniref:NAD(P)/FAD-dependent oxidoreductase n=1 Tax=Thalassobacillus hwangdonensis TaxID=546108 RepID=A0ABW3L342_9BACI